MSRYYTQSALPISHSTYTTGFTSINREPYHRSSNQPVRADHNYLQPFTSTQGYPLSQTHNLNRNESYYSDAAKYHVLNSKPSHSSYIPDIRSTSPVSYREGPPVIVLTNAKQPTSELYAVNDDNMRNSRELSTIRFSARDSAYIPRSFSEDRRTYSPMQNSFSTVASDKARQPNNFEIYNYHAKNILGEEILQHSPSSLSNSKADIEYKRYDITTTPPRTIQRYDHTQEHVYKSVDLNKIDRLLSDIRATKELLNNRYPYSTYNERSSKESTPILRSERKYEGESSTSKLVQELKEIYLTPTKKCNEEIRKQLFLEDIQKSPPQIANTIVESGGNTTKVEETIIHKDSNIDTTNIEEMRTILTDSISRINDLVAKTQQSYVKTLEEGISSNETETETQNPVAVLKSKLSEIKEEDGSDAHSSQHEKETPAFFKQDTEILDQTDSFEEQANELEELANQVKAQEMSSEMASCLLTTMIECNNKLKAEEIKPVEVVEARVEEVTSERQSEEIVFHTRNEERVVASHYVERKAEKEEETVKVVEIKEEVVEIVVKKREMKDLVQNGLKLLLKAFLAALLLIVSSVITVEIISYNIFEI